MEKRLCTIYRSPRQAEMYLYVDKAEDLARVPGDLLTRFGTPQRVMTLLLHAEKKLARANIEQVLAKIAEQGFYLQMPPQAADYSVRRTE